VYRISFTPAPASVAPRVTETGVDVCQPVPFAAGAAEPVVTGAIESAVTVKDDAALVRPAAFVAVTLFGSFGSPAAVEKDHVVPARDQPVPRFGFV
jgi:hypothetical protein